MIPPALIEIITALLRWLHVISAIAWVGASFYFIWVENALNRNRSQNRDDIAGHLWAIHGGGFYYLEKHRDSPAPPLPAPLHWFKWEAYTTWFSGMALMGFIYYLNASTWLIAPDSPLGEGASILLSLAFLFGGYLLYSLLCRFAPSNIAIIILGIIALAIGLHLLSIVFPPRTAFLHIGALIGTIMFANVLMVIIPTQKKMVAAAEASQPIVDSRQARLRSLHNNYLALPVIFLMLSAHSPIFFAHDGMILTFILLLVTSICIRHFFNCKNSNRNTTPWLIASCLCAVAMTVQIMLSLPQQPADDPGKPAASSADVTTTAEGAVPRVARAIIAQHCTSCHAQNPSNPAFATAAAGLMLDNDDVISAAKILIYERAVVTKTMPPGNITNMSDAERIILSDWLSP